MNKLIWIIIFIALITGFMLLAKDKNILDYFSEQTMQTEEVDPNLFSYWKDFTFDKSRFSASFPSIPQYAKDFVKIPDTDLKRRYEIYAADKLDGSTFMVSVIAYPKDFNTSHVQEILKEVIEELVKRQEGNHLIFSKKIEKSSFPTNEFEISHDQFKILGKAMIVDHTVYLLTYTASNENFNLVDYQHFSDSFRYLNTPTI